MPDFGAGKQGSKSFYDLLTEAVVEMTELGYDSAERVTHWVEKLRAAANYATMSDAKTKETIAAVLRALYRSKVERGGILKLHPGVPRFTLDRIAPRLRAELDRRILAAANLIRINRPEAISTTLRRFAGWATSIPPGGSDVVDKREVKKHIEKPIRTLKFEARRVATDQGHKFVANVNEILAEDGGAIAAIWHSKWRQANYNFRKDHKERDLKVYAVRGNWALDKGLMRAGPAGYTDEITKPGEEVFCSCHYQFIYNLRSLPKDMMTEKGSAALDELRIKV